MIYFETKKGKLYNDDCLKVLKQMPENSIDLIVTDPPYGYSFMGKDWDSAFVSIDIWKECLRVLKPGAFAFIMSAPRQDCMSEMIVRLRQAGFQTGFTSIYWTYASGFPKAGNIGKLVDKKVGAEREVIGIKKDKRYQYDYKESLKGKVYGKYKETEGNKIGAETAPFTEQAKALDGSYAGFQPKPAVEICIVVMKPLSEKTYCEQAMKNGKGITWLDRCRIPYESEADYNDYALKRKSFDNQIGKKQTKENSNIPFMTSPQANVIHTQGRFPANLLVSDDSLNDGKVSKSVGGMAKAGNTNKVYGEFNKDVYTECPNDSGSYSRYFDLDKWWLNRIEQLPESVRKVFPFLIVPKASKGEKNKGCDGFGEKAKCNIDKMGGAKCTMKTGSGNERNVMYKNNHPTVKPIKLMSYLIELGSSKGDTILDPFLGSGTTAISAEILINRKWIGIEREKEYCEIAKHRIKNEAGKPKLF